MCVVSMVHEHFQHDWQRPIKPYAPAFDKAEPFDISKWLKPLQHPEWTEARWNEYQELLKKAKDYDKRTDQADCPDPLKEARFKEIEAFMVKKYGLKPKRPAKVKQ